MTFSLADKSNKKKKTSAHSYFHLLYCTSWSLSVSPQTRSKTVPIQKLIFWIKNRPLWQWLAIASHSILWDATARLRPRRLPMAPKSTTMITSYTHIIYSHPRVHSISITLLLVALMAPCQMMVSQSRKRYFPTPYFLATPNKYNILSDSRNEAWYISTWSDFFLNQCIQKWTNQFHRLIDWTFLFIHY